MNPSDVDFILNYGSSSSHTITASDLSVHPAWTGFNNPAVNDDVAVVELSNDLPAGVPIYSLNADAFVFAETLTLVGYGQSGDGVSGYYVNPAFEIKRVGGNVAEFFDVDDEGSGAKELFMYDFDGANPNTDSSGTPGLGNATETTLGGGDSGGPSFIDGPGGLELFGINTFTFTFQGQPQAPRFGSGGGGIAVAEYLDFINSFIAPAPDTTAPSTPTNLAATPVSSSQIDLTWTASSDNVAVDGYNIFRDGMQVGASTSTSFSDAGLAATTTYTYEVQAFDASGNQSGLSESATAATLVEGEGFILSKSPDFSTDDREFALTDTLYILLFSEFVNFNSIKNTEYKTEDANRQKTQGQLTNHFDGTYSVSIALTDFALGITKLNVKVEDTSRTKFQLRNELITIVDAPPLPDTTSPTVTAVSPADGAATVPVNTLVTVMFSEAIDAATVNGAAFLVNDGTGNITGAITVASDGLSATFDPDVNLDHQRNYTVTLTSGITDLSGNPLDQNGNPADGNQSFTSTFETAATVSETITITKAKFDSTKNKLTVEATSSQGGETTLVATVFIGEVEISKPMKYDAKKNKWKVTFTSGDGLTGTKPDKVVVCSANVCQETTN